MSGNTAERLDIAYPADEEVRAALRLLLSRAEFNASARNKRFLNYIVEETLGGRASRIKAYSIALTVFERAKEFDPLIDPIVRIEASRLRRSLEHYYLTTGKADRIRIDVPKGAYVATFAYSDAAASESEIPAREAASAEDVSQPPKIATRRTRMALASALAAFLVLAAGLIAYELRNGSHSEAGIASAPALSIMVIPFENAGGDSDHARVARGLTYELIARLTQIREVAVFGTGGALGFGSESGAPARPDLALFGSVQAEANKVHVTAILAASETGQLLQSWSFERDLKKSNYVDLQFEIADQIVLAIRHLCAIDTERREDGRRGGLYDCRRLALVASK